MMGATHWLPEFFHVCSQSRGKANPCLQALPTIRSKETERNKRHDAHNPTAVTNTVRVTTRGPSVHSGKESHEESCARTRPLSRPCTKRPTMPGLSVARRLGESAPVSNESRVDELYMAKGFVRRWASTHTGNGERRGSERAVKANRARNRLFKDFARIVRDNLLKYRRFEHRTCDKTGSIRVPAGTCSMGSGTLIASTAGPRRHSLYPLYIVHSVGICPCCDRRNASISCSQNCQIA
jgi:hypothetical protein